LNNLPTGSFLSLRGNCWQLWCNKTTTFLS